MAQFVSGSVLTASSLNSQFNTQTIATATSNYTLGSVNAGELVLLNSASAGTVTIPLDATYNFATGTIIEMYNSGAGSWSIATAGTASTVSGSSTTLSQYQASRLIKTAPSTWFVDGGAGAANAVLKTGTSSTSGTMDFSGSVVKGAGLDLITPTSIANSGGSASASGGEITFTGVTSISLNGVLTSTYELYRVVMIGGSNQSAWQNARMRYRQSGTDNSGSIYYDRRSIFTSTSFTGDGNNSATSGLIGYFSATGNYGLLTMDVRRGTQLYVNSTYMGYTASVLGTGQSSILTGGGSVFDGFTLYADAGTISGIIRVYGYRNS